MAIIKTDEEYCEENRGKYILNICFFYQPHEILCTNHKLAINTLHVIRKFWQFNSFYNDATRLIT